MATRVVLVAIGSRGDVQPYVALAVGLKAAGYDVTLATHTTFETFVRAHSLAFAPLAANPQEIMQSAEGHEWLESSNNPVRFMRRMKRIVQAGMNEMIESIIAATADAARIIASPLAVFGTGNVAEQRGIPHIVASLQPLMPTRAFANSQFPVPPAWLPVPRVYNRLSYVASQRMVWFMFGSGVNRVRREVFNLPPMRPADLDPARSTAVLHGYSPVVVPVPPDWPSHAYVTGYWFLDPDTSFQPPADLVRFLDAGAPPVYVGFGSMSHRDPRTMLRTVLDALKQTGQRGFLLTGWGGYEDIVLPDTVFKIDSIPHSWLFPRVAAVVHHGGAGTTAAGLRAGVPTIITPFFADQPFWGHRVHALGAGPAPIPMKSLTTERLADAIRRAITDEGIKKRARALGEQIRQEDGVGNAVRLIGQVVQEAMQGRR